MHTVCILKLKFHISNPSYNKQVHCLVCPQGGNTAKACCFTVKKQTNEMEQQQQTTEDATTIDGLTSICVRGLRDTHDCWLNKYKDMLSVITSGEKWCRCWTRMALFVVCMCWMNVFAHVMKWSMLKPTVYFSCPCSGMFCAMSVWCKFRHQKCHQYPIFVFVWTVHVQ